MEHKPLSLTFAATFTEATADAPRRFSGVAYSGGMVPDYWQGDVAINLAGLTLPSGDVPILSSHVNDLSAICGKGRVRLHNNSLLIDGELTSNKSGQEVAALAASGVPLQLSVGLYQTNVEEFGGKTKKVNVNGQDMELHALISSGVLREVSFVALGADPNTNVTIFKSADLPPNADATETGKTKGASKMELEEMQARLTELEAENAALKAAHAATLSAVRETEVKALFAAIGHEYSAEAGKCYMSMDADTFAAVSRDMQAWKPALDPALTKEQAHGEDAARANFSVPSGYRASAESVDLLNRAQAHAKAHNITFTAAVAAVSKGV